MSNLLLNTLAQQVMAESYSVEAMLVEMELGHFTIESIQESIHNDYKEIIKSFSLEAEISDIYRDAAGYSPEAEVRYLLQGAMERHGITIPVDAVMPSFEADESSGEKKPDQKTGLLARIKAFIKQLWDRIAKKCKALVNYFKTRNISSKNNVQKLIAGLEQVKSKTPTKNKVSVDVLDAYNPNKTSDLVKPLMGGLDALSVLSKSVSECIRTPNPELIAGYGKNTTIRRFVEYAKIGGVPAVYPTGDSVDFSEDDRSLVWKTSKTSTEKVEVTVWSVDKIIGELKKFKDVEIKNEDVLKHIEVIADLSVEKITSGAVADAVKKKDGELENITHYVKGIAELNRVITLAHKDMAWRQHDVLKILGAMAGAYQIRLSKADSLDIKTEDK